MPQSTPVTSFPTYPRPDTKREKGEGSKKYLDMYYSKAFIKKLFA